MKITGNLKINYLDKDGNVIDTYSHKNTIMDDGRVDVMNMLAGLSDYSQINRFVLAEKGVDGAGVPLVFNSTRTDTFGEAAGDTVYTLDWSTAGATGINTTTAEEGNATLTTPSTVTTTVTAVSGTGFSIDYNVVIPTVNGNGAGSRTYSEAALYAGNRIFAMRTFPCRSKDNTVSFDIVWTITFG